MHVGGRIAHGRRRGAAPEGRREDALIAEGAAARSRIAVERAVHFDDLHLHAEKWPDEKLAVVGGQIDRRLRGDARGGMAHVGTHENAVLAAEIANRDTTVHFFDAGMEIRNEVLTDLAVVQHVAADSYGKSR